MSNIRDLADETVVLILEYLRAMDLASVCEVDKTIFNKSRVYKAVKYQMDNIYFSMCSPVKEKERKSYSIQDSPCNTNLLMEHVQYGCDVLYVREIKSILTALTSPIPVNGKGYWVSASWLANAKKYFEALCLPDIGTGRKAGAKRISKIRQRRGSDCLPPWPSMNADITCPHDSLALTKGMRAKKKLIDSKFWFFLRKFYPLGPEFKSRVGDCCVCSTSDEEKKIIANVRKEEGLRVRRSGCLTGCLLSVAMRKSGVPSHLQVQAHKMIPGLASIICYTARQLMFCISFCCLYLLVEDFQTFFIYYFVSIYFLFYSHLFVYLFIALPHHVDTTHVCPSA